MSNSFSFNLLDEPWIPCLAADGKPQELSLVETLARAPRLREIVDASPLVTAALHRLLVAILHRCFGPKTDVEWQQLWQRGSFDMGGVKDYLQQWRPRFDLFDTARPFYQTPGLSEEKAGSAAKLAHELSAGNNPLLFDHSVDSEPAPLMPAVAARYVVALQSFALGGLVSFEKGEEKHRSADSAPISKGAVLLLRGTSLFETLLLNMVNLNGLASAPFEFDPKEDVPAWEQDAFVRPSDRWLRGYLDLLTWQSRRVLLFPEIKDGRSRVSRVVIMKGYQFPSGGDLHARETMIAFEKREKAGAGQDPWPPIGFRPERVLWRDSVALLQKDPSRWRRARTFDELASRSLRVDLPIEFDALGMSSDRAKILLWRHERLPLPRHYLTEPDLVGELGRGIQLAEDAGRRLRSGVWQLAQGVLFPSGNPDQKRVRTLVDSLATERPYWAALDTPFRKLMVDLADAWPRHEQDVPVGEWARAIQRSATNAFEAAARSLETSGRGLRAAAEARSSFNTQLHGVLKGSLPAGPSQKGAC